MVKEFGGVRAMKNTGDPGLKEIMLNILTNQKEGICATDSMTTGAWLLSKTDFTKARVKVPGGAEHDVELMRLHQGKPIH